MVAPLVRNVGALYTAVDVFALKAYEHEWELEQKPVVVDIGANVGAWVVWLSEKRPGLRGTSYEPDPQAAAYLRRNLELNGLADRVDVHEEAVSDHTGTARLFQAQPGDGASSLRSVSHAVEFERESVVSTVSFDDAVARIEGDISLVKIDCEGAEYDIVEASSPEAWSRVKRVVVEYHPAPAEKLDALRARLRELGYEVVRERQRSAGEGTLWLVRTDS
jgi:FkbM family methyltransferase